MSPTSRSSWLTVTQLLFASLLPAHVSLAQSTGSWPRHTIDDSSRGADGVRALDVNSDGLLDLVCGWEEGGVVRLYLHPGIESVTAPWPAVTVGHVTSPEDAVLVDLDADGFVDVVSCCEGNNRSVYVHWAPRDRQRLLDESAWTTAPFPVLQGRQAFMFCVPAQIDGERGVDLVVGAKQSKTGVSQVGWLQSPADPRRLEDWTWHPLYDAGWIMSLIAEDMNSDGWPDILMTDRKGDTRGCQWLTNPGGQLATKRDQWFPRYNVGGQGSEVMFADMGDLDDNARIDVVTATADSGLLAFINITGTGEQWATIRIPMPEHTGSGKSVACGDINLDGRLDLVVTCEHAEDKHGVFWLERSSPESSQWQFRPISGTTGIKFDFAKLLDLDGDGDLDVLTCEERAGLGVHWYENPNR